ncbi:hypothetical protein ACWEF9_38840, partial [Streptomyces sp. NPDC004980]
MSNSGATAPDVDDFPPEDFPPDDAYPSDGGYLSEHDVDDTGGFHFDDLAPATPGRAAAPARAETAEEVLRRVFGYDAFRGDQADIVAQVVGGGDALVLMPTGGGKSLCYQVPSLVRPGVGAYRPARVVGNAEVAAAID